MDAVRHLDGEGAALGQEGNPCRHIAAERDDPDLGGLGPGLVPAPLGRGVLGLRGADGAGQEQDVAKLNPKLKDTQFADYHGHGWNFRAVFKRDRKGTLLTRPMERLLDDPHLFSGWLSMNRKNYEIRDGKLVWLRNPLGVLNDTYAYLNMAFDPKAPAAEVIWQHDHELLEKSIRFYQELRKTFGLEKKEYWKLDGILANEAPQGGYDAETWARIRSAHLGYEAGNELIGVLYMKNMNPGPTLFTVNPQNIYAVFIVFFLANLLMIPLGWACIKTAKRMIERMRPEVWDALTRQFEGRLIHTALDITRGRRIEAAQRLGIGRNTITRKIQELGLDD